MRKRIQEKDSSRGEKGRSTDRRRPENRGPKDGAATAKGKPFGKNDPFKKDGFKPREAGAKPFGEKREGGFKQRESKPFDRKPFGSDNRGGDRREGGFQPREARSSDKKPFGSDNRGGDRREGGFQPREARSFDKKPFGSDNRGGDRREGGFQPREARSFDKKPFGSDNRGGDRREGGFQPREARSFDKKPFGTDSRGGDKREGGFNRSSDSRDSRPFDKKPFRSDNRDSDKEAGGFQPRESRSFDKKPFSPRTDDRFSKSDDRASSDSRSKEFQNKSTGKPAFFKGKAREEKEGENSEALDARREKLSENRQTGLTYAPKYDEDRMKKQLPPKVLKNIKEEKDGTIRLNRYIANAGLCSRREADEFISSGQITVNGKVIDEMGYKVQPSDVVKYGRKILNREKIVYVLLNKPKDFITTTEDPEDRKTVMELVAKACEERIYPVGRLDRMTTGLLLLTNDGELADKLSHPSNGIKKVYQVELDKPITQEHFDMILAGIELEDGQVKADDLGIITPDGEVVGIEIHSGKNRIVRRIFEHLGYEVLKLDRTTYAGLTKKDLPRGKWRFLTEKEVIRLKYMI